jgi:hypothetical protein
MIDMIDFKTSFGVEKNSEIIGSIFVVCYSKTDEILDAIAPKNTILVDQNTGWMGEKLTFLSTDYCYYKKIFVIIPSFQKQTP